MVRRRRWLRFRLRTLLAVTAAVAVAFAWIGYCRRQSWREHHVAAQLAERGIAVRFDWPYDNTDLRRRSPAWWRRGLKFVLGSRATAAYSDWVDYSSVDIALLAELPRLEDVGVEKADVVNFNAVSGLVELRDLYLYDTSISDISSLKGLTRLQDVMLAYTRISDLSALANLTELEELDIEGTSVSDLAPLAKLRRLRILKIAHTSVSDLSPLSGLKNLQELWLSDSQDSGLSITDLSPLHELYHLENLYMHKLNVTEEQVQELQRKLPNCLIKR